MEIMESQWELSSGCKFVPWSSWEQWNFVRESIFSSSPESVSAALRRISAWRSRGCLPVPIDLTAAFIEIQQKDPFFRGGPTSDVLTSEDMLAMLYCMTIMRLVNCFVEPAHRKTGRSISDLADAVGIPQMLIDIRHEGSHRSLPSLPLVRLASIKALDWLKSNYWGPQRSAIPAVRKEIRSRLRDLTFHLKTKHAQRLSSLQTKGKRAKQPGVLLRCNKLSSQITVKLQVSVSNGTQRQISKISKTIARLYSSYPSEVVSVLLEFFHVQALDTSDGVGTEQSSDDSNPGDPGPLLVSIHDLKAIITIISSKKPGFVLSMLKTVLEMIEVKESSECEKGGCLFLSSYYQDKVHEIDRLCSLVQWLLMSLKALKDSGQIGLTGKAQVLSTGRNAVPKVSLSKLLHKCLALSVLGNRHLSNSVLLVAEMIGNNSLTELLEKLPLLHPQDHDSRQDSTFPNTGSTILQEESSIEEATQKLEILKLHLKNKNAKTNTSSLWTVAKSWILCPIGMLPCTFSSTAILPVLDNPDEELEGKKVIVNEDKTENDHATDKTESGCVVDENESASKRLRVTRGQRLDSAEMKPPLEGRLLIGGIWRKVSEEELLAIESNIRIFV